MGTYVKIIFLKLNYNNVMKSKAMVAKKTLITADNNNNKLHVKVSQT